MNPFGTRNHTRSVAERPGPRRHRPGGGWRGLLLGTLLLAVGSGGAWAPAWAHEHLAAGARTSEAGAELFFINAARFAAESGYVFPLQPATQGVYAGHHHLEFSFVCQPATLDFGGPAPFHPVLGSRIEAQFETVEGPPGGEFAFWEAAPGDEPATEITWQLAPGPVAPPRLVPVSQSDGSAGADPFGHRHGRVYSATLPGLYRVGLRFVDTSGNGPGGGPLHPASERFHLQFQAGVTLASIRASSDAEGTVEVSYAMAVDYQYVLEWSPGLGADARWTPIGVPEPGDNQLHTVVLPATEDRRFLRLRREPL